MFIRMQSCVIYFGNRSQEVIPARYRPDIFEGSLIQQEPFNTIARQLGARSFYFAHQTHATQGICVDEKVAHHQPFSQEADFLITQESGRALGVLTADCLPIVLHDPVQKAVAVIHAGWRGTVAHVAQKALIALEKQFGSRAIDIHAYFGPSAGACCYEVAPSFQDTIVHYYETLQQRGAKWYFDGALYNKKLLQECGVTQFSTEYNNCTIENDSYCSYRRDKENAARQMTIVCLQSE